MRLTRSLVGAPGASLAQRPAPLVPEAPGGVFCQHLWEAVGLKPTICNVGRSWYFPELADGGGADTDAPPLLSAAAVAPPPSVSQHRAQLPPLHAVPRRTLSASCSTDQDVASDDPSSDSPPPSLFSGAPKRQRTQRGRPHSGPASISEALRPGASSPSSSTGRDDLGGPSSSASVSVTMSADASPRPSTEVKRGGPRSFSASGRPHPSLSAWSPTSSVLFDI